MNITIWRLTDQPSDFVTATIKTLLLENNFQSVNVVESKEPINLFGEWCPLGFTRITARCYGSRQVDFNVTIKNTGLREFASVALENDRRNIFQSAINVWSYN